MYVDEIEIPFYFIHFSLISGTIDDNDQIYVINVKENIIYVVDKTKDDDANIVKKIELDDVIQDKSRSKCRFLHFGNNRLYIADLGLDAVYVNSLKYETEKKCAFCHLLETSF